VLRLPLARRIFWMECRPYPVDSPGMDRVQLSWANIATHDEQQCEANRRQPGRVICEKLGCRRGRVVDLSVTGAKLRLRSLRSPRKGKMRKLAFQTLMGETAKFSCRVMWTRRLGLLRCEDRHLDPQSAARGARPCPAP